MVDTLHSRAAREEAAHRSDEDRIADLESDLEAMTISRDYWKGRYRDKVEDHLWRVTKHRDLLLAALEKILRQHERCDGYCTLYKDEPGSRSYQVHLDWCGECAARSAIEGPPWKF